MKIETTATTLLALCLGCAPGSSSDPASSEALAAPSGTGVSFADPLRDGAGGAQLVETAFGRLVDVYAQDPATGDPLLVASDVAIGAAIAADGIDYALRRDPVTLAWELTILHPLGTPAFDAALAAARELDAVLPKVALSAPPYTAVPRNAALVLRFDGLVPASAVDASAVQVLVGDPAQPFAARIYADPNHGTTLAGANGPELWSTRIVVDLTVSEFEAAEHGLFLPINAVGLPPASDVQAVNVEVRLAGALPATSRVFRSGHPDDPYAGFLPDDDAPELLQVADVEVTAVTPLAGGAFLVGLRDAATKAAVDAAGERWLRLPGAWLKTVDGPSPSQPGATTAKLRLIAGSAASVVPGSGRWIGGEAPSFRILPAPSAPPFDGAAVTSRVRILLSEPVALSPNALEGLTLRRQDMVDAFDQQVVGSVLSGPEARELTFAPTDPLRHQSGQSEVYEVVVDDALTDLAGNPLGALPGSLGQFTLDPSEATTTSAGVVLTFDVLDEDGDGFPEIIGNHLYNIDPRGSIRPRPVTRFSAVVDSNRPIVGAMTSFPQPIQTPHVPLGSKMHALWRIYEVGFGLLDRTTWDVDVEGLNWTPFGGTVQLDAFAGFEMRLGHGHFLPDEIIDFFLLPKFPNSGLLATYDTNFADQTVPKVVHRKNAGYLVNPIDTFISATGTPMVPWPMNQGGAAGQAVTYTWRDTSIEALGAPNGAGVDVQRLSQILGQITPPPIYQQTQVPSIGLPLMMEFRCQPDAGAIGVNGVQIALAVNSSARPFFRVFSSGGFDTNGQPQTVDPDSEPVATGGYNPANGNKTAPNDNAVHFGQADFVVRVSRSVSRWFDTGSTTGATFSPAMISASLPEGTSATLEFRGANAVTGPFNNAYKIGAYGDSGPSALDVNGPPIVVNFLNGDDGWKAQTSDIDGANLFQFRLTLVSNIATLQEPHVGVVGVPFRP